MESPLAYADWNFIIQFHFLISRQRIPKGMGTFTEKRFIVRLFFTTHLLDISNLLNRVSPGHSKTDVPNISDMCFADLMHRTFSCKNTNLFRILY